MQGGLAGGLPRRAPTAGLARWVRSATHARGLAQVPSSRRRRWERRCRLRCSVGDDQRGSGLGDVQLNDVERTHLFDLVHTAKQRPTQRRQPPQQVRPSVQRVLDTMTESAAFVRNGHLDILAANRLGHALYSDAFSNPARR